MVTREEIVAEARTWLKTPYRHQGRLKGVSCDCAGLIIGAAQAKGLGLGAVLPSDYAKRPDGTLEPMCDRYMLRVPEEQAGPGDVVLFHWQGEPGHLAMLTAPDVIIHAFAINREVCEHRIDAKWRRQIVRYYHIPGVE